MRPIDAERFCPPRGDLDRCWGNGAPEAERTTSRRSNNNKHCGAEQQNALRVRIC